MPLPYQMYWMLIKILQPAIAFQELLQKQYTWLRSIFISVEIKKSFFIFIMRHIPQRLESFQITPLVVRNEPLA